MITPEQFENNQFIRLAVGDPDYNKLIQGDYPTGYQVKPIKSLIPSNDNEFVTFHIDKVIKEKPLNTDAESFGTKQNFKDKFLQFFNIYRVNVLLLTLLPLLSVHFFWQTIPATTGLTVLTSYMALLFFHGSIFFMNDYFDHISGNDWGTHNLGLMKSSAYSFRAKTLRRIGLMMFAMGVALGTPLLIKSNIEVLYLALFGGLCIFVYSMKNGLKSKGYGDFLIIIGMGPLLTVGFSMALWGTFSIDLVFSGLVLGMVSVIYFQMKNLESLLKNSFVSNGTLISRLGFDSGKKLISAELIFISVSLFSLLYIYGFSWVVFSILLVSSAVSVNLIMRLNKINSPLSNNFIPLRRATLLFYSLTFLIIISSYVFR